MTDIDYMTRAYYLALKGKGTTSPNPMVGAVLVKNNRIIAEDWHRRCGEAHAEVLALQKAGHKARDAKLYITLEPCFHYGSTPPCVDKIIKSRIKEVIVGMKDPNPVTNGKSLAKLRRAGIKAAVLPQTRIRGPRITLRPNFSLKKEIGQMNESFVKYITKRRPFVVAKIAQTLDGKIATAAGQSKWITSEKTRAYARRLRNDFDAILVGINTVQQDNPGLNAQKESKHLRKIILDTFLKVSPRAKLFAHTTPADCILATTQKAPAAKIQSFRERGVQVIVCPEKQGRIQIKWLLKELAKRRITNILFEGGAQVIGNALKEKVIDKIHLYIAPRIIGDQRALSAIDGLGISQLKKTVNLKDLKAAAIGQDLFLEGYVQYNH